MKYFAYGSNLYHQQMAERCPESAFLGPAVLKDYKLIFDGDSGARWDGGGVANIVLAPGADVWGGLYEISEHDLENLDRAEVYPSVYDRKEVEVESQGAKIENVIVYFRLGQKPKNPSTKYIGVILQGAHDCRLPAEYIKNLEKTYG